MNKTKTIPAKYIFLDIVGYSSRRSVEAQTDIVHTLNQLVRDAIAANEVPVGELILLPTGDGLCIALLNIEDPFDIHLRIALYLLELLHKYNESVENNMRSFQVRIGINANTDNLVTDINGNQNIAGAGINMAQRVMSNADGNQILVGQSVFDTLNVRESYMNSFRSYRVKVKHGISIDVHQFIDKSRAGLNTDVPRAFIVEEKAQPELSLRIACYFAHLIKNRDLIIQRQELSAITTLIMFWFRASISAGKISRIGGPDTPMYPSVEEQVASFDKEYKYYWDMPDRIQFTLAEMIQSKELFQYIDYFEELDMRFINEKGREKLEREWPNVWEAFELDTAHQTK